MNSSTKTPSSSPIKKEEKTGFSTDVSTPLTSQSILKTPNITPKIHINYSQAIATSSIPSQMLMSSLKNSIDKTSLAHTNNNSNSLAKGDMDTESVHGLDLDNNKKDYMESTTIQPTLNNKIDLSYLKTPIQHNHSDQPLGPTPNTITITSSSSSTNFSNKNMIYNTPIDMETPPPPMSNNSNSLDNSIPNLPLLVSHAKNLFQSSSSSSSSSASSSPTSRTDPVQTIQPSSTENGEDQTLSIVYEDDNHNNQNHNTNNINNTNTTRLNNLNIPRTMGNDNTSIGLLHHHHHHHHQDQDNNENYDTSIATPTPTPTLTSTPMVTKTTTTTKATNDFSITTTTVKTLDLNNTTHHHQSNPNGHTNITMNGINSKINDPRRQKDHYENPPSMNHNMIIPKNSKDFNSINHHTHPQEIELNGSTNNDRTNNQYPNKRVKLQDHSLREYPLTQQKDDEKEVNNNEKENSYYLWPMSNNPTLNDSHKAKVKDNLLAKSNSSINHNERDMEIHNKSINNSNNPNPTINPITMTITNLNSKENINTTVYAINKINNNHTNVNDIDINSNTNNENTQNNSMATHTNNTKDNNSKKDLNTIVDMTNHQSQNHFNSQVEIENNKIDIKTNINSQSLEATTITATTMTTPSSNLNINLPVVTTTTSSLTSISASTPMTQSIAIQTVASPPISTSTSTSTSTSMPILTPPITPTTSSTPQLHKKWNPNRVHKKRKAYTPVRAIDTSDYISETEKCIRGIVKIEVYSIVKQNPSLLVNIPESQKHLSLEEPLKLITSRRHKYNQNFICNNPACTNINHHHYQLIQNHNHFFPYPRFSSPNPKSYAHAAAHARSSHASGHRKTSLTSSTASANPKRRVFTIGSAEFSESPGSYEKMAYINPPPIVTWKKNNTPLDIPPSTPLYDILNKEELDTCSILRILPSQYLRIRDILLRAYKKNGFYLKKDAKRWCRGIDVNKTAKLYEFWVEIGWLPFKEMLAQDRKKREKTK